MIDEILNNARRTPGGRRVFTSEQKRIIVDNWADSGLSGPEFSRRYGLITTILYKWRKDALRGATMGIKNEGDLYTKAELDGLKRENDELKKALADATLDNRILKKKLELDAKREALKKSKNSKGSLE